MMKTLYTFIVASAICVIGYAQDVLRPEEQIIELQRSKIPFSRLALFKALPVFKGSPLPDATYLTLQEDVASSLIRYGYQAIEITLPRTDESIPIVLYKTEFLDKATTITLANAGNNWTEQSEGVHYRGVVKDKPGSLVSLSIYQDEVLGVISIPGEGNLTLARYQDKKQVGTHVLYNEDQLPTHPDFQCFTPDTYRGYNANELSDQPELRANNNCLNVYLEVDYDIFVDKGGLDGTTRYIKALFNEVATLYANEKIRLNLSELFVWNTPSTYTSNDASGLLGQFKNKRAGLVNGDAGMLISYKGGGGIAVVDGLCQVFNLGYAGIGKSYSSVPAYSFSVMVFAHELGHILGSQHTHACVWNNNNTAIDGCPGFVDGSCSTPPVPREGGTIMSYCHISQYGINFALGFGTQPGNLIRNRIATAPCLLGCKGIIEIPKCGEINLTIVLDAYGNETSWELVDGSSTVVDRGGPYSIQSAGLKIQKTICLPTGCYTFRMLDSHGDGMCCKYGNGSFLLSDNATTVLAQGNQFSKEASTSFCIDQFGKKVNYNVPPPNVGCTGINFNDHPILSFGDSQDQGIGSIVDNGKTIELRYNTWKAIAFPYEVTANTFLEFDFRSTQAAEINGIGFDEDLSISTTSTFQLWGSQAWGYQDFNNYEGNVGLWKHYIIPVGQKFKGKTNYLFFACDNDASPKIGNSQFRNIQVYETKPCSKIELLPVDSIKKENPSVGVFPNPANDQLNFDLQTWPAGNYQVQLFDLLGRTVLSSTISKVPGHPFFNCSVAHLPAGMYAFLIGDANFVAKGKILIERSK